MAYEPLTLNHQKFKDSIMSYAKIARKEVADVMNDKMGSVALRAVGTTRSTNTSKISADLERVVKLSKPVYVKKQGLKAMSARNGKVHLWTRKIKSGAIKHQAQLYEGTYRLTNWILKNQGLPTLGKTKRGIGGAGFGSKEGTIADLAKALVASRKRSVNFIRQGWLVAARYFGKGSGKSNASGGGKKATPNTSNMEAMIFNGAVQTDNRYFPIKKLPNVGKGRKPVSGAKAIGEAGLKQAIELELANMAAYIKPRMYRLWETR
ncbi:MAG: hypothetical protein EBR82_35345 [Caulobacteraceae bacterium]|nr:hypothetical protein [Caulobacteraceae bacterium]